jgi:uncharacterized ferritin-like protein (DUF455 family)
MELAPETVQVFCRRILTRGDLATKLAPPGVLRDVPEAEPAVAGVDRGGEPAVVLPARDAELALGSGAAPLPKPGALRDPAARAIALARFAHHELQAAELFAWALLRWPRLPADLRRAWLGVLADEQRHCRLYIRRLEALGARFGDFAPHSDYFWQHAATLDAAPAGPRAFLAVMGLTLEQANLDFSALYRDAFREAGDQASAEVCARVHEDEIGHVALAARWLARLSDGTADEVARYEAAVPFPFGPARAKGRRFEAGARRKAGLGEAFIAHVRDARSTSQARPRGGT